MGKDGSLTEIDYLGNWIQCHNDNRNRFSFIFIVSYAVLQGQEKYGLLNVTKITENGKKVR